MVKNALRIGGMKFKMTLASAWSLSLFVLLISAFGAVSPAWAEEPPPLRADGASDWQVDVYSWLWAFGVSGDIGIGSIVANDVNTDFIDIVEEADSVFGFSGRIEVGYDRVTAFVDGTYAKVGIDNQSGPLGISNIDITNEIGIVDFGVLYRLTEWDSAVSPQEGYLATYAGGRYLTLDLEMDPAALASVRRDRDWVDPLIGVKVSQPLTEHLHLDVWGDIGGFGVESDLTWSATAVLGMDFELFNLPTTVYGGYRAIGWDYTKGSGADRFEWDVVLHGPALGLQIRF